jgi:hypothetical protein
MTYRIRNGTSSSGVSSVAQRFGKRRKNLGWGKSVAENSASKGLTASDRQCSRTTPWGQCCQPALLSSETGLCISHETWTRKGRTPDRFYEEKIVKGLTEPTFNYMSETEAHAVLNGRYRGDGRRVDLYIVDDPLGIDEENL